MNSFSWKTWGSKIKKIKRTDWLILFLVGVLILILAIPTGGAKKGQTDAENGNQSWKSGAGQENTAANGAGQQNASGTDGFVRQKTGTENADERARYICLMEKSLEELLGQMEGVGKVKVMLTLKDEGEDILDKDVTSRDSGKEVSSVVYRDDGTESPYVTKRVYPKVEGVVVVAQGGGNPQTANNISEAVMALFGVELHKIKIVKMRV